MQKARFELSDDPIASITTKPSLIWFIKGTPLLFATLLPYYLEIISNSCTPTPSVINQHTLQVDLVQIVD